MNVKHIIAGLVIIHEFYDDKDGFQFSALPEQIFMEPTPYRIPEKYVKKLHELGWIQPGTGDTDYNPDLGWHAHV